jgi:hypothetical protein
MVQRLQAVEIRCFPHGALVAPPESGRRSLLRRVGFETATTKPQGDTMLKRIALTAVFVATAAIVGVSAVKAKAPTIRIAPPAPQGLCLPPGNHC